VLTKLAFRPYGLFLVSHSKEIEVETRTGKYTRIVPTLPDKARKIVLGMVDMVLYCDLEDAEDKATRRVIRTKPAATTRPAIGPAVCQRPRYRFRQVSRSLRRSCGPAEGTAGRQNTGGEMSSQQEKRP